MPRSAFLPLARDTLLRFKTLHYAYVLMPYTYDALGRLIRVNDPNDPTAGEGGTTWLYNYERGGDILSKSCHHVVKHSPFHSLTPHCCCFFDDCCCMVLWM